jgi:hypothetical protein
MPWTIKRMGSNFVGEMLTLPKTWASVLPRN